MQLANLLPSTLINVLSLLCESHTRSNADQQAWIKVDVKSDSTSLSPNFSFYRSDPSLGKSSNPALLAAHFEAAATNATPLLGCLPSQFDPWLLKPVPQSRTSDRLPYSLLAATSLASSLRACQLLSLLTTSLWRLRDRVALKRTPQMPWKNPLVARCPLLGTLARTLDARENRPGPFVLKT